MKNVIEHDFQNTYTDLKNAKNTFALDVLSYVLEDLEEFGHNSILTAEDLDEGSFWMENYQHEYQPDKFLQTVDALVDLDLLHLTKFGADLEGHSIYRKDALNTL